jgi:hypothetical protein
MSVSVRPFAETRNFASIVMEGRAVDNAPRPLDSPDCVRPSAAWLHASLHANLEIPAILAILEKRKSLFP